MVLKVRPQRLRAGGNDSIDTKPASPRFCFRRGIEPAEDTLVLYGFGYKRLPSLLAPLFVVCGFPQPCQNPLIQPVTGPARQASLDEPHVATLLGEFQGDGR